MCILLSISCVGLGMGVETPCIRIVDLFLTEDAHLLPCCFFSFLWLLGVSDANLQPTYSN